MISFVVIEGFVSEELRSEYVAGLSYTARDEDKLLLSLIPKWIEEGKIRESGSVSEMSAVGEVVNIETKTKHRSK